MLFSTVAAPAPPFMLIALRLGGQRSSISPAGPNWHSGLCRRASPARSTWHPLHPGHGIAPQPVSTRGERPDPVLHGPV